MLLQSIHLPIISSSSPPSHSTNFPSSSSFSPFSSSSSPLLLPLPSSSSAVDPPVLIRFKTSHRQNLQYLRNLGIISSNTKPPPPSSVSRILTVVDFLRSNGFSDSQFSRLAFLCPQIFSSHPCSLSPVLSFLSSDLAASPLAASALISTCPSLLLSDVNLHLRPTIRFLHRLGLQNLSSPSTLNAHLLASRVDKLMDKIRFLQSLGLSPVESRRFCARFAAVFGYSVEDNLKPKFEFLTAEMGRTVDELKEFPQYFAFSLNKRIAPRHFHLKERAVRVSLQRMLLWSDQRFYAKWK